MARSYKKAIKKNKPTINYNKVCRARNKQRLNMGLDVLDDNAIVNQYKICDYVIDLEHTNKPYPELDKWKTKIKRKK